jgi:hypothetical protein
MGAGQVGGGHAAAPGDVVADVDTVPGEETPQMWRAPC